MTISKFTIISQDNCNYCEDAKSLLRFEGYEFNEFNLKDHPSLKEFIAACGQTMVPQIYQGPYYVGGHDDLVEYMRYPY